MAQADNVLIGNTPLPPPVPHLNRPEDFFLGSGVAGGGGAGDGTWNFLVGPNYTCPNYLRHEEIRLVVDGMERPLTMDVFRARETGIFCGTKTLGDLEVYLIDYARRGEPWVARLVLIKNRSPSVRHQVRVRAYVNPIVGAGRSDWMAEDESGHACGVGLKLDTSLKCVENWCCQNWSNRCALITFNDPDVTVIRADDGYIFETGPETIAPGASWNVALYHYLHYGDQGDSDCIQWVRQRNAPNDAAACVRWWRAWFDGVAPRYSLHRIKDPRARDLVEGGLAILKMNECRDGGIVANERGWRMSYIRDAYCGLRGLGALGHFVEAKRFIQWVNHVYSVHGLIPNAAVCGSDTYVHPSGNNGKFCPEANAAVEVTALYLLAARDYYRATRDLQTLTSADPSLRYAMDIQLKEAILNGNRLEFNGDETELCGAADVRAIRAEGFNRNPAQYWSMTSVALCSASLEFYIQYLKAKGDNPAAYWNRQDKRTLNLYGELGKLQDALERDFWRTNVPGCPEGFHDWFRAKRNLAWPSGRIVNFTLFPVYYGTPLKYPDRAKCDVVAMKQFFEPATRLLPLVGKPGGKSLGHDLGYLLWGLVAIHDTEKAAVYDALVNGPTVGCWGSYHEAYSADGTPNQNGLRTFETGVNLSAIGKYWGLGGASDSPPAKK
ncbi:MAG: hypothetical protein KGJ60_09230 [Verrucomicrobiota bacterium]|nr:hypothetical protein [Verrucomicrobiota bacterium]